MKDILMNESLTDLDATMAVTESEEQTMALMGITVTGEWKASPQDGLNVSVYMGAPSPRVRMLRNKVQEAMERNGIGGEALVEGGKITIKIK